MIRILAKKKLGAASCLSCCGSAELKAIHIGSEYSGDVVVDLCINCRKSLEFELRKELLNASQQTNDGTD